MIELFSKKEDFIEDGKTFSPLLVDESVSSLSVIILNDEYYKFLLAGKKIIGGISVLDPMHLIAFKAKAHVDLNRRKEMGEFVSERDSKKHRNDIFRLLQLLSSDEKVEVDDKIKKDIRDFLELLDKQTTDVSRLTNNALNLDEAVDMLRSIFCLK